MPKLAERPERLDRPHAEMLDNIRRHAVVTDAHLRRPRALQLQRALAILIDLGLLDLAHLVLISMTERLSNDHPTNSNGYVPVVKRCQCRCKSFPRFPFEYSRHAIRLPRSIIV